MLRCRVARGRDEVHFHEDSFQRARASLPAVPYRVTIGTWSQTVSGENWQWVACNTRLLLKAARRVGLTKYMTKCEILGFACLTAARFLERYDDTKGASKATWTFNMVYQELIATSRQPPAAKLYPAPACLEYGGDMNARKRSPFLSGHYDFGRSEEIAALPTRDDSDELWALASWGLRQLCKRDREVIEDRFGLNGPALTLKGCGEKYGLSRERVRQLEERAMKKLRDTVGVQPLVNRRIKTPVRSAT